MVYTDANQLRIWAWETRSGQMLTLGCTFLGPQNFRETHDDPQVPHPKSPATLRCPDVHLLVFKLTNLRQISRYCSTRFSAW